MVRINGKFAWENPVFVFFFFAIIVCPRVGSNGTDVAQEKVLKITCKEKQANNPYMGTYQAHKKYPLRVERQVKRHHPRKNDSAPMK